MSSNFESIKFKQIQHKKWIRNLEGTLKWDFWIYTHLRWRAILSEVLGPCYSYYLKLWVYTLFIVHPWTRKWHKFSVSHLFYLFQLFWTKTLKKHIFASIWGAQHPTLVEIYKRCCNAITEKNAKLSVSTRTILIIGAIQTNENPCESNFSCSNIK